LSALPAGAFWTSTPLTDEDDSWTISGENLRRDHPRWEVHFDTTRVRVARVGSARDWIDLIESNAVDVDGCKYPDWPAIARSWDATRVGCGPAARPSEYLDDPFRQHRRVRLGAQ
jgi:hypothetical protein